MASGVFWTFAARYRLHRRYLSMAVIRTRALSPIIDIIRRFNLEPETIVAPLGIDINTLLHPKYEDQIDILKAYALLEATAEKTQCPFLGALLGNEQKLYLLGPIGLLMEHSPDIESALRVLIQNQRVQQNLSEYQLEVFDHSAWFTITAFDRVNREGVRHFIEGAIFTLARFLHLLIGPDFRPDRICFAHAAPEDISAYRRLARTKVSFSEEENTIIFSEKYLKRQKKQSNEELSQALTNYLELLQDRSSNDLLTHMDFIIQRQLRSGACTLPFVANELGIHPRNLQRQLKSMGTTFNETLTAYRSRLAIELLKDPSLQITQIAHRLGYSDATAFGQAFKKWFNKMPREYRKQLN